MLEEFVKKLIELSICLKKKKKLGGKGGGRGLYISLLRYFLEVQMHEMSHFDSETYNSISRKSSNLVLVDKKLSKKS